MEHVTIGESLTLDNDKVYGVIDIVESNNKRYLYLVNPTDVDVLIAEEVLEGDQMYIETIEDKNLIKEISQLVFAKLKQI